MREREKGRKVGRGTAQRWALLGQGGDVGPRELLVSILKIDAVGDSCEHLQVAAGTED